jgi:histidyl-tRNA synthetase
VTFRAPRGTYDIYPPESARWVEVRDRLLVPARRAGYGYAEAPVFEDTAVFARGVGESTDVVSKEMYTFTDRGGRSVTLRPEETAGMVRLVLEHGLDRGQLPVKLYYAGPMFRYERMQSGRFRQFQQVGIEALGVDDPALDAEVVVAAVDGFTGLGLREVRLLLSSLGDAACRPAYTETLRGYLRGLPLDDDTRRRVELNPLRVLDDKRPEVQQLTADAPVLADALCEPCRRHHDTVRTHLADLGVTWTDAPRLVRGLDYYRRTTFEFQHAGLGAQSAVGGGGRYDGLAELLGGPPLPGIGWALGIERTLLALDAERVELDLPARVELFAVPLGAEAKRRLVRVVAQLRRAGVAADLGYGERGMKGALKAADRSGARYALLVGDRELDAGVGQLKDLRAGGQRAVPLEKIAEELTG